MKNVILDILKSLGRMFGIAGIAFVIGTAASAGVYLYYGIPLIFSLIGGIVVLGIALAMLLLLHSN